MNTSRKQKLEIFRPGLNRKRFVMCSTNHFYTPVTKNIAVRLRISFYVWTFKIYKFATKDGSIGWPKVCRVRNCRVRAASWRNFFFEFIKFSENVEFWTNWRKNSPVQHIQLISFQSQPKQTGEGERRVVGSPKNVSSFQNLKQHFWGLSENQNMIFGTLYQTFWTYCKCTRKRIVRVLTESLSQKRFLKTFKNFRKKSDFERKSYNLVFSALHPYVSLEHFGKKIWKKTPLFIIIWGSSENFPAGLSKLHATCPGKLLEQIIFTSWGHLRKWFQKTFREIFQYSPWHIPRFLRTKQCWLKLWWLTGTITIFREMQV